MSIINGIKDRAVSFKNGFVNAIIGYTCNRMIENMYEFRFDSCDLPIAKISTIGIATIVASYFLYNKLPKSINNKITLIKNALINNPKVLSIILGIIFGGLGGYFFTSNGINIIKDGATSLLVGVSRYFNYSKEPVITSRSYKSGKEQDEQELINKYEEYKELKKEYDYLVGKEETEKEIRKKRDERMKSLTYRCAYLISLQTIILDVLKNQYGIDIDKFMDNVSGEQKTTR